MYMNMPIVDEKRAQPYGDTPNPKVFGNVSAFDPQLFSTSNECAESLVGSESPAKYTPLTELASRFSADPEGDAQGDR